MSNDVVVLLSGGVDSMVLLWRASRPLGLFVDYGQRSAEKELEAATALSAKRGCALKVVRVEGLSVEAMNIDVGAPGPRVVHGRNLLLISLGVNAARSCGASEVWIGCHADDEKDYPDCRPEFIESQNRSNRSAYLISVKAPLLLQSRASFIAEARFCGAMALTWSCYSPTDAGKPCGTCNSCRQVR